MKPNLLKLCIVCFGCLLVASGCAPSATGPEFKHVRPRDDNATITHYRLSAIKGSVIAAYLYSNDKFVTYISNGGYFQETVKPGIYKYKKLERYYAVLLQNLLVDVEPIITLNVEPGKEYYIKWSIVFGGKAEPEIVSKDQALTELVGLNRFEFKEKKEEAENKLTRE